MMPRKLEDTVALVLFEDRIEDVVGGGEEDELDPTNSPSVMKMLARCEQVGVYGGEDHGCEGHQEEAVVEVERSRGDQGHDQTEQDGRQHHRGEEDEARAPLAVHHRLGERADQDQRHEQRHRREEERDDEQGGDQQDGDADHLFSPSR